jgi:hypothetical protein
LALSLWNTGNIDAQLLATAVIELKNLSTEPTDRIARSVTLVNVEDWLRSYVVKEHTDKVSLRKKWMPSDDCVVARA